MLKQIISGSPLHFQLLEFSFHFYLVILCHNVTNQNYGNKIPLQGSYILILYSLKHEIYRPFVSSMLYGLLKVTWVFYITDYFKNSTCIYVVSLSRKLCEAKHILSPHSLHLLLDPLPVDIYQRLATASQLNYCK